MAREDTPEFWKMPSDMIGYISSSRLVRIPLLISAPYTQLNCDQKVQKWYDSMGKTWEKALRPRLDSKLVAFVENERLKYELVKVYPSASDMFSWTRHCSIEKVKVVIVGQDPYPQPGKGNGLAFSHSQNFPRRGKDSLSIIFEAMQIDGYERRDRNLTGLAKQGVLLLNTVLTVRENCPNSHANKGWEDFTNCVIRIISRLNSNVMFLLWGNNAKNKASLIEDLLGNIDTCEKSDTPLDERFGVYQSRLQNLHRIAHPEAGLNFVLTAEHPSPLASKGSSPPFRRSSFPTSAAQASPSSPKKIKFKYCHHFKLTNYWLNLNGMQEIVWDC